MASKRMGAGAFKQTCLAVLDDVADNKTEVIITKRGRPVARLVPVVSDTEREEEILAGLRGKGKLQVSEAEFLAPSSGDAAWAALDDER